MTSTPKLPFDENLPLLYLDLPKDYEPSPKIDAISFLTKHLPQLPPHILLKFSDITSPKQRTTIPNIRNRRLTYTNNNPPELRFYAARSNWPTLWEGRERRGIEEGNEEKEWAESRFLEGSEKHIGKLAKLLGEYEEEREAERIRIIRREKAATEFTPEEDTDSEEEEEEEEDSAPSSAPVQESQEEAQRWFERLIRERFIYGLLENIDYDKVDWDESLDIDDEREAQERWFDDDDDE
ncbi:hypothetical protein BDQ12DRAFT_675459 [Crucibulum laeve]|uniref:CCD97-like C-terminal domain-containing protein n=1 Tax=Crucibulum laeve TaxID=68775 RepID=A0A5C3MER8_9AGAR|nr:hypothetical protein BDQ12DRAFT_675459 [Crucibulum laeve]